MLDVFSCCIYPDNMVSIQLLYAERLLHCMELLCISSLKKTPRYFPNKLINSSYDAVLLQLVTYALALLDDA